MPHKKTLNTIKFAGFATAISDKKIYDNDLIKQDLLNHIYTRKGERLMDPEYGSTIWDILFETKTDFTVNEIERDLRTIIESDARVQLRDMQIIEEEHGYTAAMTLYFNITKEIGEFRIEFNNRISQRD